MARPITTAVIFFAALNFVAGVMQAQGIMAALGVGAVTQDCPDNPTNEQIQNIPDCQFSDLSDDNSIESGSPTGSTLFGMYNVLTDQAGDIYDSVLPGLVILENAGVPGWITEGILGNLFGMMIIIAAMSYLRGYNL